MVTRLAEKYQEPLLAIQVAIFQAYPGVQEPASGAKIKSSCPFEQHDENSIDGLPKDGSGLLPIRPPSGALRNGFPPSSEGKRGSFGGLSSIVA